MAYIFGRRYAPLASTAICSFSQGEAAGGLGPPGGTHDRYLRGNMAEAVATGDPAGEPRRGGADREGGEA